MTSNSGSEILRFAQNDRGPPCHPERSAKGLMGSHAEGGCGKAGQMPLPVSNGSPHIRIRECVVGER